MSNDETDEGNAEGKETPTAVTPTDKPTTPSKAQELKKENDLMERELQRAEELTQRAIMGGRATAGQETKISEEEKLKEETEKFLMEDE